MKKFVSLLAVLIIVSVSHSQNIFPNGGNVGINTATPTARLDVNGNMKIDSCLLVKDSILVEKDMRTKGEFRVEGKAYFTDKVFMQDELSVTGQISTLGKIKAIGKISSEDNIVSDLNIKAFNNVIAENNVNATNNVNVGNKLKVDGNAILEGNLKLPNIGEHTNLNNLDIEVLVRKPNGNVVRADDKTIRSLIYNELPCIELIGGGGGEFRPFQIHSG